MSESSTWGLIGPGSVGQELMRQIDQDHVAQRLGMNRVPEFVLRSSGFQTSEGITEGSIQDLDNLPDVVFVAMPTTDDGETAKDYITHVLDMGKMAITAEKGAIANHFQLLKDTSENFKRLGVNATVGGGTRIVESAKHYTTDPDNVSQIHLSFNGTLSAIMSLVGPAEGAGQSLGQAVQQASRLGFAEPGAQNPFDVIRGEAEGDIPKKTAIFFNRVGLSEELVDWKRCNFDLTDDQISQTMEEARTRRFLVSMYSPLYLEKANKCPENGVIGGFDIEHDGWRLIGGFRDTTRNPLFTLLTNTTGPSNGFAIGLGPNEEDGVYTLTGPGAGVNPTANTMIDDFVEMKKYQN